MVCARMRKQSACVARSFKVSSLSYEDSNTVVASGVAGIVCSAESVGLREGFKEEGEKRLFGIVQSCLPGVNVLKKDYKN